MVADREGKPNHIEQVDALLGIQGRYSTRKRTNVLKGRSHDRKLLVRISLIFMVISIAVIVATVFMYFRAGNASRLASGESGFDPDSVAVSSKRASTEILDSLDPEAASKIVKAALGNRNPALVTSYFVLGSSAATPREAIALLDYFRADEGSPDGLEPIGGKLTSGRIAEEVVVTSVKDGRMSNRVAQLLPDHGKWRIDLDSYARHVSPGWEEILGRKCDAATVRVFVTPDSYYNGGQFSEDSWRCYALISPDVDEILFGYAARDSVQEEAMERILSKEEPVHKATLRLKVSENQGPMQFEISQVIADDWLVGETRFDESF